jgi:hypothetical protein
MHITRNSDLRQFDFAYLCGGESDNLAMICARTAQLAQLASCSFNVFVTVVCCKNLQSINLIDLLNL